MSSVDNGIGLMLLGGWCIVLLLCWWRSLLIGWVIFSILIKDVAFTTTFTIIIIVTITLSPPPSSSPQTVSPQHSPLLNYFFITITFHYSPTPNYISPTTSPSFNYKSSHTDSTSNYTSLNIDANYPSIQRYSSLSTLSSSDC